MASSRFFLLAGGFSALLSLATFPSPVVALPPVAGPTIEVPPTTDPRHIPQLVEQLGAGSFRERERASRALIKIGVPAKAELLKALVAPDAEVRYRARLVLADVLDLDFKQRLSAFIDDTSGAQEHDLPGWARFRDLVGDGPATRRLFAEMQRCEPVLMEALELSPQHAGSAFDTRCLQIQEGLRVPGRQTEKQVPLGSVATLLFIGADSNVPISMQAAMSVTNFCYQQPFRHGIAGGDAMPPLKKLVGGWVRRDFGADSTAIYQLMMLALQFNIPEGVEPAFAMLKDAGVNPHMRQYALLVVGKFGAPADVDRLEVLLDDPAVCAQQQIAPPAPDRTSPDKGDNSKAPAAKAEVVETQIRDVTLAVMLHLTGQKLADYGYTRVQPNATMLFNTASLGFASGDQRDDALAKWRAWRTASATPK